MAKKKILPYDSDSVYILGVQKCRSKKDGVYGTFCISWPSDILTTFISHFCPPLTSSKLDQCLFLTSTFDFVSYNITLGQRYGPTSNFPPSALNSASPPHELMVEFLPVEYGAGRRIEFEGVWGHVGVRLTDKNEKSCSCTG
jgi:hypothetical protein